MNGGARLNLAKSTVLTRNSSRAEYQVLPDLCVPLHYLHQSEELLVRLVVVLRLGFDFGHGAGAIVINYTTAD